MLPRTRARHLLSRGRTLIGWPVCRAVLLFFLTAPLPIYAQQMNAVSPQAIPSDGVPQSSVPSANPPTDTGESEETNPPVAVAPSWVITHDSDGNVGQQIKVGNDFALGEHARLGVIFGQAFVYKTTTKSNLGTQSMRDLGLTSQWHPNDVLKVEGMVGASQLGSAVGAGEQPVSPTVIPIANLQFHITPPGDVVKLDVGFKRFIFDLSPELVANRAVRNDFIVHPQISLPSGWRLRELAEIGPVTSTGQSNNRFNSESTLGHKLGKSSELYSTYTTLHFAQPSAAGYFSPDLVQNAEGGWSTDLDRKSLSLSLDCGAGAGRAKTHGESFGPLGLSMHAASFLTWTSNSGQELSASYEFYYDQSNPGVAQSSPGAWHMSVVTFSFRWSRQ
jgi:hypothetical protein